MTSVAVVAHDDKLRPATRRALLAALAARGIDASWTTVPKAKKARKAATRAVEQGVDVVVACGGDGTVRAASEALVGTAVALAVVPVGTANLFAGALALPTRAADVIDLVADGARRRIDTGVCNDMVFNVMAGTGFDAAMIADADDHKQRFGLLAYARAGFRDAHRRQPFGASLLLDGKPFYEGPATCVLVGNLGRLRGGLQAFPDASPVDGLLDVAVVTATGLKEWARVFAAATRRRRDSPPHAHVGQAAAITVELDGSHRYELDGGAKGKTAWLDFAVRPLSLTVCAPAG
ncbi:MAG: diacylglycerol kinase family protein [Ilumatobacteraceae bacterium]